ncbi:hypothetical protein BCR32DRAFT_272937 [Anaeromyces robustus]|uniref:Uncharacterized protein n=1 Tax=Anaeromyces robustus TaxID=1754192 RepID=A0A1Y1VUA0_9FUNG|nr:hypothetical protein BCR32DRAFT_272937 [Anaeromyces robustus]|eukprot:ORX64862.1 hypothetical protein BCR32DRAFT_272937 [Anaeromyces robustus]
MNNRGNYPLLQAIHFNNEECVKLLIQYANNNKILLNLNEKNKFGYYPLITAIYNNNINIIKLLMNYADKHEILLNINENNFPLLEAINNNNNNNNNNTIIELLNGTEVVDEHKIFTDENKTINDIDEDKTINDTEVVDEDKTINDTEVVDEDKIIDDTDVVDENKTINDIDDIIKIYKHVYGDKETFWIGFEIARQPFYFNPLRPAIISKVESVNSETTRFCGHKSEDDKFMYWNGHLLLDKNSNNPKLIDFNIIVDDSDDIKWQDIFCGELTNEQFEKLQHPFDEYENKTLENILDNEKKSLYYTRVINLKIKNIISFLS